MLNLDELKSPDGYLKRIEEQIKHHDRKAVQNKKRFNRSRLLMTCLSSSLSLAVVIIEGTSLNAYVSVGIVTAVISFAMTVINETMNIDDPKFTWPISRRVEQTLWSELHLYAGKSGAYANINGDIDRVFRERCESILSDNVRIYFEHVDSAEKKHAGGAQLNRRAGESPTNPVLPDTGKRRRREDIIKDAAV